MFAGEVSCSFQDGNVVEVLEAPSFDSQWDDDSACQCLECGWSGQVADIVKPRKAAQRQGSPPREALSAKELDDIERQILSGECPAAIFNDVRVLITAIRQLQKHVQILETVSRANSKRTLQKHSDTTVL